MSIIGTAFFNQKVEAAECVFIGELDEQEITLKKDDYGANNCFTLSTKTATKPLSIHPLDTSNSSYSLRMIQNKGVPKAWNSIYWDRSNVDLDTLYDVNDNITQQQITFYVDFDSEGTDKVVTITSFTISEHPQLIVRVKTIPSLNNPVTLPLITDPICLPGQICNILQSVGGGGVLPSSMFFGYQLNEGESYYTKNGIAGLHDNCTADNTPPAMPDQEDMNDNIRQAKEFGDEMARSTRGNNRNT